ncbi:catalase family peroxidase [Gallaecimonas kandeliae]|uniref:catalase family peroxidase n=1 Tax=Gallaecimonas kandeliae TaxID=3029055 RepID=UPI0026492B34|nr:catalase family peroxidase [Gallaecimonas kandeliae]WKE66508.1 catalase family peroxidase [Gallaecimonas kandeliae]
MKLSRFVATTAFGCLPLLPLFAFGADSGDVGPVKMISAMEDAFGVHPGQRRNHIKGSCALGEFTGLPAGAAYSRSKLFSGDTIPVTARFSVGGGNPAASDAAKGVRGMALEFKLPGGAIQHMTMINMPIFGAAKPQTFYDMLVALKPDPATHKPDPEAIKTFAASHPDYQAMGDYAKSHNPPPSYANSPYYSLHAFWFVNKDNHKTLVRWHFEPQDGVKFMTDEQMQKAPADFLEKVLIDRTHKGPVKWDLVVTLGQEGDPQNDPSKPWPADRKEVTLGTLAITQAMAQKGAACEPINFDPMVVADGIAVTDDPVLRARSAAYAVSFGKRLSGN